MDPTAQFLLQNIPLAVGSLIAVWAFATGRVHSDSEYRQLRTDLETERAAHEQTRAALGLANARADAGVRAAELVASAVEGARHVPQAPASQ